MASTPNKPTEPPPAFVFTPLPGSGIKTIDFSTPTTAATNATSASSTPQPFVFGAAPAPAASATAPSFEFNFGSGPPTSAAPLFTVGVSPARKADSDGEDEGPPVKGGRRSGGGARNPFADDAAKRKLRNEEKGAPLQEDVEDDEGNEDDADEDGEDGEEEDEEGEDGEEEDFEDEDDGGTPMDSDDEGDLDYPFHEESANTVKCDQCGDNIPRPELATHQKRVCKETPMECPFSSLHCGSTAWNRRLLRAHVSRNVGDHIVWLMSGLEEQRRTIQQLSEALQEEQSRRQTLEHAIEQLGGKIDHSRSRSGQNQGQRGGEGRDGRKNRGGNGPFSPSPGSQSPPARGGTGGASSVPSFSISFDASKPLAMSDNRWTPHSLPIGDGQTPSKGLFPKGLAGTGNVASDEQTRLKVAAGLLPPSTLNKTPSKSALAASASTSSSTAATTTPGVDDLPALTKQLKSVLNKLTAANFEKLSSQVVEIFKSVTNESSLTSLVVMLFDKAVVDSYFSNIYSMLCGELSTHLPPLNGDPTKAFKRYLLNQCQVEFESGAGDPKKKARMLGTIRFIGELYRKDLILQQIMAFCIMHLLPHLEWSKQAAAIQAAKEQAKKDAGASATTDTSTPADDDDGADGPTPEEQERCDSIEAFCKLLITIGQKFDSQEQGKKLFDETVFPRILQAQQEKDMPSRLRFMLKDLYELRQKRWTARAAASQSVAEEHKVKTTVEMGLGNGGVSVQGSTGRGAVHSGEDHRLHPGFLSGPTRSPGFSAGGGRRGSNNTSQDSSIQSSPAMRPMHIHHDSHSHNSMFQSLQHDSGRKGKKSSGGGGGGSARGKHASGGHPLDSRRGGRDDDDSYSGGGGGQWLKGDLIGSGGKKSGGGGQRGGGSGNRRR